MPDDIFGLNDFGLLAISWYVRDCVYQWYFDLLSKWGWACWTFENCVENSQGSRMVC